MSPNDCAGYLKVYRTPLGQRMSVYTYERAFGWAVIYVGFAFPAMIPI